MEKSIKNDIIKQYDSKEITKRAFKYILEGIVVGVACYYLPKERLGIFDIICIALVASISFSILDMYAPSIEYCNLN